MENLILDYIDKRVNQISSEKPNDKSKNKKVKEKVNDAVVNKKKVYSLKKFY